MKTVQKLVILARKDDPAYPFLKHDVFTEITAPLRNRIHNLKDKLLRRHYGIEGYVNIRVKRARRNAKGEPVDKYGKPILNTGLGQKEYEEELNKRCVYDYGFVTIEDWKHNLLTTNGRDWIAEQVLTNAAAASAEQGAQEVAVSTNTGGASAAHDVLSGTATNEINANGLTRKNADTITHTDNTNSTALVTTFTATATHTDVQLAGLFYDPTSRTGQLIFENTFTATTLNNGDILELTWTITIG